MYEFCLKLSPGALHRTNVSWPYTGNSDSKSIAANGLRILGFRDHIGRSSQHHECLSRTYERCKNNFVIAQIYSAGG